MVTLPPYYIVLLAADQAAARAPSTWFANVLQILGVLLGLLLVYISVFLYESDHRGIQDLLERLWIYVEEADERTRRVRFLSAVARLADAGFNHVFGPRLFSVQAVSVTLSAGLAAIPGFVLFAYGWLSLGHQLPEFAFRHSAVLATTVAAWFTFCLLTAHTARHPRHAGITIIPSLLIFAGFGSVDVLGWWQGRLAEETLRASVAVTLSAYLGMFLSMASLIFYVGLTRWLLRKAVDFKSSVAIVAVTTTNLLIPLLPGVPIWIALRTYSGPGTAIGIMTGTMVIAGLMNLAAMIPALAFFLLGATALLHRLCWPFLARPLYKLASMGIVKRRVSFGMAGSTLLSVLGGKLASSLLKIVEFFS